MTSGSTMEYIILWTIAVALLLVAILLARYWKKRIRAAFERKQPAGRIRREEIESSISTTRTLLNILRDRGVSVERSEALLAQAEISLEGRLYSRAEELLKEAKKEALKANKAHQDGTDILNKPPPSEEKEGPKEVFRKFPQYYFQAKFEIGRARDAIESAVTAGRNTEQAEEFLRIAEEHFRTETYDRAFSMAVKAKKSADGEEVEEIVSEKIEVKKSPDIRESAGIERIADAGELGEPGSGTLNAEGSLKAGTSEELCPKCGGRIYPGDRFCRKCGYEILRCPNCGALVLEDDVFCGKCGYKLVEEVFVCPNCGAEIPGDAIICPNCGARFE